MSGKWQVWGDGKKPKAVDLDEDAMREMVDADENDELYGENEDGITYPKDI